MNRFTLLHPGAAALALALLVAPACGGAGDGPIEAPPAPAEAPAAAAPAPAEATPSGPVPGVPVPPPPRGATEGVTALGLYRFRYETAPQPIPLGQLFEVRTHVVDARTGEPVPGVKVDVDARMPDHGHGMETKPEVVPGPHPGGVHVTRGMKFHMPGSWTITVEVEGESPDRIEFVHTVE